MQHQINQAPCLDYSVVHIGIIDATPRLYNKCSPNDKDECQCGDDVNVNVNVGNVVNVYG